MFFCSTQIYYYSSVKELIRIHGTTKSLVASYLSESIVGAMTIRAFGEEDRFFLDSLKLIDRNQSSFFHSFSANEWLMQRLELLCAIILSSSALALTLLPLGASESGQKLARAHTYWHTQSYIMTSNKSRVLYYE